MRTNVANSIQEYCKKINRELTFIDILSLCVSTVGITFLLVFIRIQQQEESVGVVYQKHRETKNGTFQQEERPFGSRNGVTYTFKWCQGSNRTLEKNKVYFINQEEAEAKGRRISKLCQK